MEGVIIPMASLVRHRQTLCTEKAKDDASDLTSLSEYAFPNDEQELERLDMQHAMMTLLINNKLFWSPIAPDPHKILDLGTGTGVSSLLICKTKTENNIVMLSRHLGH
jgi:predicted O-methyltransferase YrrM